MTKRPYPTDVVEQARSVLDAWQQINPEMTFGDLTLAMLTGDVQDTTPIEQQIINLETQLTNARNERDALYAAMWEKLKRVRAGVKANYGDDSSQYEMVGGTRRSERKAPARKAAPTG